MGVLFFVNVYIAIYGSNSLFKKIFVLLRKPRKNYAFSVGDMVIFLSTVFVKCLILLYQSAFCACLIF